MSNILALRDRLSEPQRAALRRAGTAALKVIPLRGNLELLAIKHGTDKWTHGYIPHYQRHFRAIRNRRLNVLEIGIGTTGPRGGGDSLRMWRDFFPKATIFGLDILDKAIHAGPRIEVLRGSQNDPAFLAAIADRIGRIDIVIDDGSHINERVITSFNTLFPRLADGGIYVIEDMVTSYYPKFGGDSRELDDPGTMLNMLKRCLDNVQSALIPNRAVTEFDSIGSMHIYQGIAFLTKNARKRAVEPSPFLGDPDETKRQSST